MLNQTVVVGRLVQDPEITETENGKKVTNLTLAVPRTYKNANGDYDTDFVDCVLWAGIAENTTEYCKKGDIIGIKGRIQTDMYENSEGKKQKSIKLAAEKVSFLSSAKKEIDEEVEKEETSKKTTKTKNKGRE